MSGEGFLARWSRRAAAVRRSIRSDARAAEAAHQESAGPDGTTREPREHPSLPDPDTLGRHSDYSVFLDARVPEPLRRAALRRAWRTDEAIAGFRGMAEYDWDFNAPGAVVPLDADEALRVVEAVLGPAHPDEPKEERVSSQPDEPVHADAAHKIGGHGTPVSERPAPMIPGEVEPHPGERERPVTDDPDAEAPLIAAKLSGAEQSRP